eukprot:m51a1_g13629 hypothetical protein (392) ;mRNA; f:70-1739
MGEALGELARYRTWGARAVVRAFRELVWLLAAMHAAEEDVEAERAAGLGRKLADVRYVRQLGRERCVAFSVRPEFYRDARELVATPARLAGRKTALVAAFKVLVRASASELVMVLARAAGDPLDDYYFRDEDCDVQSAFNEWLLDQRAPEGKQVQYFVNALRESAAAMPPKIRPDEVVSFIAEFAERLAKTYSVAEAGATRKLSLLLQRALLPLAYREVLALSPDYPFAPREVETLGVVRRLRERLPASLELDAVYKTRIGTGDPLTGLMPDPFYQASRILADLAFQTTPTDCIHVVQSAIAAICDTARTYRPRELGADEILPLFQYVFIQTDLPGVHEALFLMTSLSQPSERISGLGWATATLEAAVQHVQELASSPDRGQVVPSAQQSN